MTNISDLTIESFHEGLVKKKFSAREIAQAVFANIKETDQGLGAYLSLNERGALKDAERTDMAVAKGEEVGPLSGVPLAIKDNILIKGLPATAGSKLLEHYTAAYDAGVIKKLKHEQAVFVGKTNLDEFAMGSSTENSAFKITRNPHDPERVPGGSSGGSTAAVAANLALGALGSDTGGSIRQPAGFCGVVGLKPTYGAVSRSGLIALASSLDQIGPITKTVRDAEILFRAIRGADRADATSQGASKHKFVKPSPEEAKKLTLGLPREYMEAEVAPEVRTAMEKVIADFTSLGVTFKEVSLPHTKYALSCYYIILPAEASSNLARFDGIRYARNPHAGAEHEPENLHDLYLKQRGFGLGSEPKRRIILGTFVLSSGYYDAYYKKAQQVRTLIRRDFDEAFESVDAILAPVSPTTAFKIGEKAHDPLAMYLSDAFTLPVNLAGLPALAIPSKPVISHQLSVISLPIGFQLIGKHFAEGELLALGEIYEHLHNA